jgi:ribose 1,5-bisphosphokinase PhnN
MTYSDFPPLLALIGPSGSGKSTLATELVARGVVRLCPTWTTRPRRPNETPGGTPGHCFVSDSEFDALERSGFFAAIGRQSGLPYRYGLGLDDLRGPAGLNLLLGRASMVPVVMGLVPTIRVYQLVAPPAELGVRLAGRGEPDGEVALRFSAYLEEVAKGGAVAERIFRGDGPVAVTADAVQAAISFDFSSMRIAA